MGVSLILAVLAIIGVGLTYWFLQQEITNHKQQTRRKLEELEHRHDSRIQEILECVQGSYQTQLKQATEELKQQVETYLEEYKLSLENSNQAQLENGTEMLKQQIESQLQSAILALKDKYQTHFNQRTEKLKRDYDIQLQQAINFIQEGYDNQAITISEPSDLNIENSTIELHDRHDQEILEQSPAESQSLPLVTNSELSSTPPEPSLVNTNPSVAPTTATQAQTLAENLIKLGNSGQVAYIPKLTEFMNHPNNQIRESVASALGSIAASQGTKAEMQRAIPVLGKLSRDSDSLVRQSAVEALGHIKSEKVIPLLSLALRDSNRSVVQAASAALNKFKFYPINQKPQSAPKSLTKKPKH
jgi:hypothetical protein